MRILLGFVLFADFLASATSANAQECSTADQPPKTWNQQPPGALCGTGRGATPAFTVYSTTVDTCTNNTTGVVYAQSSRQTTGDGLWQCWSSTSSTPSLDLNCNPTITQQVTHATSSTDYNRFYL
jgi:hypothetical protein